MKIFTVIRPVVCLSGPMLNISRNYVLIGYSIYNNYSRIATNPDNTVKIVSEYDQEIPKSQTADKLMASEEEPHSHHETSGRQTKQSNQPPPPLPHQDDCKTRIDLK